MDQASNGKTPRADLSSEDGEAARTCFEHRNEASFCLISSGDRFVQFTWTGPAAVILEAVSQANLPIGALAEEKIAALGERGFRPAQGAGNYWQPLSLSTEEEIRELIRASQALLREVYDVTGPIAVQVGWNVRDKAAAFADTTENIAYVLGGILAAAIGILAVLVAIKG